MMTLYAIAIAVQKQDSLCLFGRRRKSCLEYSGYWSLPTVSVNKENYRLAISQKRLPEIVTEIFNKNRLAGIHLSRTRLLESTVRIRTGYRLEMAVFSAKADSIPKRSEKYSKLEFLTLQEALSRNDGTTGTCLSAYLQHLISVGALAPTLKYLELPPEIADSTRPITEFSDQELWQLCSPNHSLLINGRIGRDGAYLRKLALDPFLTEIVQKKIRKTDRVLDIGCASGHLLSAVRKKTEMAYGLDIAPTSLAGWRSKYIRTGNLYKVDDVFSGMSFDLVILNLMVEWIGDLNIFLKHLRGVLTPDARLVVTSTSPEFTKNIEWQDGFWRISKCAERDRELTMINGIVGPVWLYPRSTAQYISIFSDHEFCCVNAKNLYADTYLSSSEKKRVLDRNTDLVRNTIVPLFTGFEFHRMQQSNNEQ